MANNINETLLDFLSYTKFFCTPLKNQNWNSINDIHPAGYKNQIRLIQFLGDHKKEMHQFLYRVLESIQCIEIHHP